MPREFLSSHLLGNRAGHQTSPQHSEEKGVLAKGVSVESSVTPTETKTIQGYWAQQHIWHSEFQPREACIFQKPPSKKPLFLHPGARKSGFCKRGCRNGVTSDFFCFFHFLLFSSVNFLPFLSVFFCFISVFFLSVSIFVLFGFFVRVPIFSVFFRFIFRKNGETPFARPLLRNPEQSTKFEQRMTRRQKNARAHKNKIGTLPPPPPKKKKT